MSAGVARDDRAVAAWLAVAAAAFTVLPWYFTADNGLMVGIKGKSWDLAALEAAGVRRVSLATSLWRAAMAGVRAAAKEVQDSGTFGYVDRL